MLAAALAFGVSLAGSFHFDDYALFTRGMWKTLETRPLTAATFWLNREIGGRDPLTYHAAGLALHLSAVLLLYEALRRLIPQRAAWIAAAIFAVHPIQAEAVNYVFARGTLLNTLLCIAALLLWVRGRHWWAVACFAAALAAKEECVAFPVFLLLLHLSISRNRRELKPIAVMLLLSLSAGVWVYIEAGRTPGSQAGAQAGISAASYFWTQGYAMARYCQLLIFPIGLNVDPEIAPLAAWRGALLWVGIAVAAAACLRWFSGARPGFWFLSGLVLLLPSSSIFPASDLAADRRLYLPMIAIAAGAGLLLARLRPALVAAVAAALIVVSVQRSLVWRSEESLWSDAVRKSPHKLRPKLQLARAVEPSRALELIGEAKAMAPDDPRVATEAGRIYLDAGDPVHALAEFGRALALRPNNPQALNNRGAALLALGQAAAARQDFEKTLSIDPCEQDARDNLQRLGVTMAVPANCR